MAPTTRSMTTKGMTPRGKTMHGETGFDRQELQDFGALESDAARPPTLANDVHALFHKDKFIVDVAPPRAEWDQAYETLQPAFRLVSRWITDPSFRSFWEIIRHGRYGKMDLEPDDPEAGSAYSIHLEDHWKENLLEMAGSDPNDIPECFDNYALYHHFRFRSIHHAWAETRSQSVYTEDPEDELFYDHDFRSVTILHDDFFHFCYTAFPKASKSRQVRFLFFFAVNLGHELAHLMMQRGFATDYYFIPPEETVLNVEPFIIDSSEPHVNEPGTAWERFMFGGRIQPLNQSPSLFVPDGLAILPLDMVRNKTFGDSKCRIAPLLTDWISDQFSETWWEKTTKAAVRARLPGHPHLARARATVNRTTDSNVFLANAYLTGEDAIFVADHIAGGSPGHRIVRRPSDTYLLTGALKQWHDESPENENEEG